VTEISNITLILQVSKCRVEDAVANMMLCYE